MFGRRKCQGRRKPELTQAPKALHHRQIQRRDLCRAISSMKWWTGSKIRFTEEGGLRTSPHAETSGPDCRVLRGLPCVTTNGVCAKSARVSTSRELIGQYVPLKKRGNDLVGLCPFHAEKTPSFHVHPDRGFFKCFGCGRRRRHHFLAEVRERRFRRRRSHARREGRHRTRSRGSARPRACAANARRSTKPTGSPRVIRAYARRRAGGRGARVLRAPRLPPADDRALPSRLRARLVERPGDGIRAQRRRTLRSRPKPGW